VPLFLDQITQGGPITVTDPAAERYFLTMDEGVHSVLCAVASCSADDGVAIPVMGAPVSIADLAKYLIAQSSAKDVTIVYTGLRPGDKLREEFVSSGESVSREPVNGVYWIHSSRLSGAALVAGLAELTTAMDEMSLAKLLAGLTRLVPEHEPSAYLREQVAMAAT